MCSFFPSAEVQSLESFGPLSPFTWDRLYVPNMVNQSFGLVEESQDPRGWSIQQI
jgi:hypothetical protein